MHVVNSLKREELRNNRIGDGMLKLKKTVIAVFALGSSFAFAGTIGSACVPGSSTVPCTHTGWDFGAQALYLRPSYSGADYLGVLETITTSRNVGYSQPKDPWSWGFKIAGSYQFYTGNDLNLNWYHYRETNNKAITVNPGYLFIDPVSDVFFANTSVSRNTEWDAVNLEFGQHVNFGTREVVRFHGGIQYARINTKTTYLSPNSEGATSATQDLTYNGFGARVGMDMTYNWTKGLSIYANGATAIFIGPNQFSDSATGNANDIFGLQSGSNVAIVPELEVKLGAMYTYITVQGDLSFETGWMWVNYFNALQNSNGNFGIQQADFGVQGPFFGVKYIV